MASQLQVSSRPLQNECSVEQKSPMQQAVVASSGLQMEESARIMSCFVPEAAVALMASLQGPQPHLSQLAVSQECGKRITVSFLKGQGLLVTCPPLFLPSAFGGQVGKCFPWFSTWSAAAGSGAFALAKVFVPRCVPSSRLLGPSFVSGFLVYIVAPEHLMSVPGGSL